MELSLLTRGQKVALHLPALPNLDFEGSVAAIGAGADPQTGSYPVEITWSNNPQRDVKSGMSVTALINSSLTDSAIVVPLRALVTRSGSEAVFLYRGGNARLQLITAGRKVDNTAVVSSGLSAGDTLVLSAVGALSAGAPLQPTTIAFEEALQ
jgi:membrane fusion protein (multidrug efflux system)